MGLELLLRIQRLLLDKPIQTPDLIHNLLHLGNPLQQLPEDCLEITNKSLRCLEVLRNNLLQLDLINNPKQLGLVVVLLANLPKLLLPQLALDLAIISQNRQVRL